MTMLLLSMCLAGLNPVSAQEIPRNQILRMAGYTGRPSSFNPMLFHEGSQGFDLCFIYEPLFGVNLGGGFEIINWLGESIEFIDSLTIEVTLRDDIYWVILTDDGPEVYRDITTADVRYSYLLYGAFTESGSFDTNMNDFRDRVGSINNFEVISPTVFRVHLNSSYPNSGIVFRAMTKAYPIVPEDVWTEILAAYPANPLAFANDWTDPAMPDEWKVGSGMYLPFFVNTLDTDSISKRNDLWWGKDDPDFGRLPYPVYVENVIYASNEVIPGELEANNLDWDGNFVGGLTEIMADYPNIHTFYFDKPYFPDKACKLMVPNHRRWPIAEPWLHKAIASVLNYTAFSEVASSGYMNTNPSPFLMPKDDGLARLLINETLEEQYRVPYDPTGAYGNALLEQYCDKIDGIWYTTAGPSDDYLATYPDRDPIVDALPAVEGTNVALGPWELLDWAGWTDVNAIDVIALAAINELLGIPMTALWLDWGGATTTMDANNYDFVHFVMHWGMNGNMYERYNQMFVGAYEGLWNHYGSYRNATLVSLIQSLDTVPAGSQAQQEIANDIQVIIGENLPIIPFGGHPDWYIWNNYYWIGFSDESMPILPAGPYQQVATNGALLSIVFSLHPNNADLNGDGIVDILDITLAALAFGSTPDDDRWITIADVDNSREIDIVDLTRIAIDFGQPTPPP